ncbi:ice-binding family protein [Streptomyces sp. NPDC002935]|uniref:ice-binding family protein n=1 Tax=Streptomyces sp. NPDC002935 TaxID=3154545 RepID=UPI00339FD7BA
MVFLTPTAASAIALPVPLGTTAFYSVLAGQGVTNTGNSVLAHDLGTHPNPSITGFPPGLVQGAVHAADANALQAKSDLIVAYNNAAGQAQDFALPAGIGGGPALLPGVYHATAGVGITGDLILDGQGSSDAVWVFQIPESLTTATSSRILLTNGASACNVFWQIGQDASLGVTTSFVGTLMAGNDITVNQGTNVEGRLLAQVGSVTLNNNRIFLGGCAASTTGGTTTGTTTGATTGGGLVSGGLITGGVLGGPLVSTGGTSGNIAGNTSGITAGNTSGNTAGNTAGNTTGGITAGNTTGGPGGGHGHAPGRPEHGGHGKPEHGGHGKPDHGGHGKPDHGGYGKPDQGGHGKPDHGGKVDDEQYAHPGKPDHGKQPEEDYGYDDVPKGYEGDHHSKSYEG